MRIRVLDDSKVNPIKMAVYILKETRKLHPDEFIFLETNFIDKLYGSKILKSNILSNESLETLFISWQEDKAKFSPIRERYLLY